MPTNDRENQGSYPLLATVMAKHPALQMFRRFSALNLRSILYYEAELLVLQNQLEHIEKRDAESNEMPTKSYRRSWENLAAMGHSATQGASGGENSSRNCEIKQVRSEQWQIMCQIRSVLEPYYQALQRQAEVENGFVAPTAHEFGNLRNWHRHPNMGNHFLTFETEDAWDLMGEKGLIAKDFFAVADTGNYLAYWLGIWYCALRRKAQLTLQNAKGLMRRCCARKPHASNSSASNNAHDPEKASDVNQIQSLSDNGADRITSGVVTILASVLLVVPIYALYVVHRLKVRLGLVCLFTVLLAAMTTFALRMSTEKVLAISTA